MRIQLTKGSLAVWVLLIVVILASFVSTLYTNQQLRANGAKTDRQADCNTLFLGKTFEVLNERTAATPELNDADAAKVRAEGKLFGFITRVQASNPPGSQPSQAVIDQYNKLISNYFHSIQSYLNVLGRQNINQVVNPIPTPAQYRNCLHGAK